VVAHAFHPEPIASDLAHALVSDFLERSPSAEKLAERMLAATGSRFRDALDVLSLGASDELRKQLRLTGFVRTGDSDDGAELWEHTTAIFPLLELRPSGKRRGFVRVDSIVDYLEASGTAPLVLEGDAGALVRRALVADEEAELWVVERSSDRRRTTSASAVREGPGAALLARHLQAFRLRPRPLEDAARGFETARELIVARRKTSVKRLRASSFSKPNGSLTRGKTARRACRRRARTRSGSAGSIAITTRTARAEARFARSFSCSKRSDFIVASAFMPEAKPAGARR